MQNIAIRSLVPSKACKNVEIKFLTKGVQLKARIKVFSGPQCV